MSQTTTIHFWKEYEVPYGCFSQWCSSPFIAQNPIRNIHISQNDWDTYVENYMFDSAEKFMMFNKALLFATGKNREHNIDIANTIMKCKSQKNIKDLGRDVRGFDETMWIAAREDIVVNGNYFKFSQNPSLKTILINTGNRVIVEASPYDRIWGIGFVAKHANVNKINWGLNLLGKALMTVRYELTK
jgi:ribA/ribD-fused uncharacterized protein